jgi:mannose/fructose/N-acetylgalactosamine-specific phosphotransferase system component IIC
MAFLSLDITSIGQFMISRPIVIGPIAGFLLGQPIWGLTIGVMVEIIWIGDLAIGAHIPIDLTLLTVVAVALGSSLTLLYSKQALVTYCLGAAIPFAYASSRVELWVRKLQVFWMKFAQKLLEQGSIHKFKWIWVIVLIEQWIKNFLMFFLSLTIVIWARKLFVILPTTVIQGLKYSNWFLMALGCATAIHLLMNKIKLIYLILLGMAVVIVIKFMHISEIYSFESILVIGFVIYVLYFQHEIL